MPDFVLDGSMTLSWCFDDESTPFTDSVQMSLQTGKTCIVPPIWPSEVANGIRVAERRGRISVDSGEAFLSLLFQFPIEVILIPPITIYQEVLPLAREHNLTVYDASYLSLALRHGLPLATLDDALRKAVRKAGGILLQEQ